MLYSYAKSDTTNVSISRPFSEYGRTGRLSSVHVCCLIPSNFQVFIANKEQKCSTYTWEFDATVAALGRGTLLLDVKVSELTTGSLDHADLVRLGVVSKT